MAKKTQIIAVEKMKMLKFAKQTSSTVEVIKAISSLAGLVLFSLMAISCQSEVIEESTSYSFMISENGVGNDLVVLDDQVILPVLTEFKIKPYSHFSGMALNDSNPLSYTASTTDVDLFTSPDEDGSGWPGGVAFTICNGVIFQAFYVGDTRFNIQYANDLFSISQYSIVHFRSFADIDDKKYEILGLYLKYPDGKDPMYKLIMSIGNGTFLSIAIDDLRSEDQLLTFIRSDSEQKCLINYYASQQDIEKNHPLYSIENAEDVTKSSEDESSLVRIRFISSEDNRFIIHLRLYFKGGDGEQLSFSTAFGGTATVV